MRFITLGITICRVIAKYEESYEDNPANWEGANDPFVSTYDDYINNDKHSFNNMQYVASADTNTKPTGYYQKFAYYAGPDIVGSTIASRMLNAS
ncbi:hypothetical protein BC833DRAFT_624949 [Globomyces pollinis-pini]|nr:hypothetical protein BC833DRAFT_624949 [Globomyces pollinis-pini]